MAEKDEEIEAARKNLQRQLESLQSSLEEEVRAKNNLNRQRKATEDQLGEVEANLGNKEKEVQDHAKNIKKLQAQLKVSLPIVPPSLSSLHKQAHCIKCIIFWSSRVHPFPSCFLLLSLVRSSQPSWRQRHSSVMN